MRAIQSHLQSQLCKSQQSSYKVKMADRRLWTPEEDQVIRSLIEEHGTSQWSKISKQMRDLVPIPRTAKQIRQRWLNQLSPDITRAPWTLQEDRLLFNLHSTLGNRWKDIAKSLSGRTDNAVKNHFYATVRRSLRRLDKHFGFKECTKKIRSLKPASLTHLLETARILPEYEQKMSLILQFAQEKPSRDKKESHAEHEKKIYRNIIEMINNFNNSYSRSSKETQSSPRVKIQESSSNQYIHIDNLSTLSDEQMPEESPIQNYFGSVAETGSWFSVNQREWATKIEGSQDEFNILCDLDMFQ